MCLALLSIFHLRRLQLSIEEAPNKLDYKKYLPALLRMPVDGEIGSFYLWSSLSK